MLSRNNIANIIYDIADENLASIFCQALILGKILEKKMQQRILSPGLVSCLSLVLGLRIL